MHEIIDTGELVSNEIDTPETAFVRSQNIKVKRYYSPSIAITC
jgi:hypothetical protein